MNKLFIYGCSFSTDYTRQIVGISGKTWYEYVAEHFNLELKNYAQNASGVPLVISNILKTHLEWGENDLVIIEVPSPLRFDIVNIELTLFIPQLIEEKGSIIDTINNRIEDYGIDNIEYNTINIWNGLLEFLKTHKNKNIYTWFILYKENYKHINLLYEGSIMDWKYENKADNRDIADDYHFSPEGSKKFYNLIIPKINYKN